MSVEKNDDFDNPGDILDSDDSQDLEISSANSLNEALDLDNNEYDDIEIGATTVDSNSLIPENWSDYLNKQQGFFSIKIIESSNDNFQINMSVLLETVYSQNSELKDIVFDTYQSMNVVSPIILSHNDQLDSINGSCFSRLFSSSYSNHNLVKVLSSITSYLKKESVDKISIDGSPSCINIMIDSSYRHGISITNQDTSILSKSITDDSRLENVLNRIQKN